MVSDHNGQEIANGLVVFTELYDYSDVHEDSQVDYAVGTVINGEVVVRRSEMVKQPDGSYRSAIESGTTLKYLEDYKISTVQKKLADDIADTTGGPMKYYVVTSDDGSGMLPDGTAETVWGFDPISAFLGSEAHGDGYALDEVDLKLIPELTGLKNDSIGSRDAMLRLSSWYVDVYLDDENLGSVNTDNWNSDQIEKLIKLLHANDDISATQLIKEVEEAALL